MKPKPATAQQRAHELLQEWAQGPAENAHDEQITERVDGGQRPLSEPERHAIVQDRYETLDRAVRQVYRMDRELSTLLWRYYGERKNEVRCAEIAGLAKRTWRHRLYTARAAFLAAFQAHQTDGC